jgi:hypothetical protein
VAQGAAAHQAMVDRIEAEGIQEDGCQRRQLFVARTFTEIYERALVGPLFQSEPCSHPELYLVARVYRRIAHHACATRGSGALVMIPRRLP